MSEREISINLQPMRLLFTQRENGGFGFGFELVDEDGDRRAITARDNPLVRGSSFDLYPTEAIQKSDTEIRLTGKREYEYTATIRADVRNRWFEFDVELDLPESLQLSMVGGLEPEIMLDLGCLPPYERGDHVWFMTTVTNPTKWNDDAYGNDMPATYYFDSYIRAEFMMFFDMTAMSWMSLKNTGRFLNYRCGFKRRYQPQACGAIGLYLDGFCGREMPAGKVRFKYFITAAPRAHTPTDHEAVQWLVERCLSLLPERSEWPKRSTNWRDFSLRCAQDLMTEHAWHGTAADEYLLNYVDAHSPAWQACIESRGVKFDMDKPCLESAVWGAHPLGVLCKLHDEPVYQSLKQRMLPFIDRLIAAEATPLAIGKDLPRGTWQHVYIVEQMFQVARNEGQTENLTKIRREIDAVIIPLARKMQYFFPLSFDNRTLSRRGSGDAHSLLGTYASLMLDMHEWTGEQSYLDEAMQALRVNYRLPVNAVHQEIFMLAMGVHAAARLAAKDGGAEFDAICRYLLAQTLRMLHWFDDRTTADTRAISTLGMFQACATISYPALFENIETLSRIAAALKVIAPTESLLRVFDHARKNNFYFFPQCLEGHHDLPLKFVPLENIGILEGPPPTSVGAEIYGAGWVFRAYLLWEALGHCTDREIMVVNCDNFDERRQLESGAWNLTYYIFNPTAEARDAEIVFPVALERAATVINDAASQDISNGRWTTRLAPGEFQRVGLIVHR